MMALHWLFWGVAATFAQMLFEAAAVGLRLTRISLPFMLGTIMPTSRTNAAWASPSSPPRHQPCSPHRWNAATYASVNTSPLATWVAKPYTLARERSAVHELLPEIHPRMASERSGPTAMRQLEPPGFLALNYGPATPVAIVASHVIFGVVIGAFCHR